MSVSYERFRQQRYFRALDGLRALAVLMVMFNHVRGHHTFKWLAGSTNGVTLFFILSGFLITTLCLREEDVRGALDASGFSSAARCGSCRSTCSCWAPTAS